MGLSTSMGGNLPRFSADILRLETHGRRENHLSVIDVPGIVCVKAGSFLLGYLPTLGSIWPACFISCTSR